MCDDVCLSCDCFVGGAVSAGVCDSCVVCEWCDDDLVVFGKFGHTMLAMILGLLSNTRTWLSNNGLFFSEAQCC